jgi:GLPGLI family protein
MKKFHLFILLFAVIPLSSFGQEGTYVKYDASYQTTDSDLEMMMAMFEKSSLIVASDENYSYTKSVVGTITTTEVSVDNVTKRAKIYITGSMMDTTACEGDSDSLSNDKKTNSNEVVFKNETKNILGYKCKKAVMKNEDGTESIYWYTEKIKRPIGYKSMPSKIPGICLEMKIIDEWMISSFLAVEIVENIDSSDYKVIIPQGVRIKPISVLN